jgi:hypothetical protein
MCSILCERLAFYLVMCFSSCLKLLSFLFFFCVLHCVNDMVYTTVTVSFLVFSFSGSKKARDWREIVLWLMDGHISYYNIRQLISLLSSVFFSKQGISISFVRWISNKTILCPMNHFSFTQHTS